MTDRASFGAEPSASPTEQRAPLDRRTFDAATLIRDHPPRWTHPNKRLVFEIGSPPGAVHRGAIGYSRWRAEPLPDRMLPGRDLVTAVPGYFDYEPVLDGPNTFEWHVNFADPELFSAYAGRLFAQDEMQVTEHPALGALKEALESTGILPMTTDSSGPTPVLVSGVERRVTVSTAPDDAAGLLRGLYGNAFAAATPDAVRTATRRIDPPTITNLIAIAAPHPGRGTYDSATIESILATAYTGFSAAVREARRSQGDDARVAVHTGFWGCGAFGGNRTLMSLLQITAAGTARVDRLVFHTGQPGGEAPLSEALAIEAELVPDEEVEASQLVEAIVARGFKWGISDGN